MAPALLQTLKIMIKAESAVKFVNIINKITSNFHFVLFYNLSRADSMVQHSCLSLACPLKRLTTELFKQSCSDSPALPPHIYHHHQLQEPHAVSTA